MKDFAEQLNLLKLDDDEITTMEKFSGTTTYITLKGHRTGGCQVHVLDERQQGNIYRIPKW